jgi:hypothetical protein
MLKLAVMLRKYCCKVIQTSIHDTEHENIFDLCRDFVNFADSSKNFINVVKTLAKKNQKRFASR